LGTRTYDSLCVRKQKAFTTTASGSSIMLSVRYRPPRNTPAIEDGAVAGRWRLWPQPDHNRNVSTATGTTSGQQQSVWLQQHSIKTTIRDARHARDGGLKKHRTWLTAAHARMHVCTQAGRQATIA
jgi:hypothetical protein